MRVERPLFLHEEVLLLALRGASGTIAPGTMYAQAIGGALFAELALRGRVVVEDPETKPLVEPVDTTKLGEPLLDECLAKIAESERRATVKTWMRRFASMPRLKHRIATGLCRLGILRAEEGTFLFVFGRTVYPETNPRPERKVVERLRRAVFTDNRQIDPRTLILASLANGTGVLQTVFDRADLEERKERLERLTRGEIVAREAGAQLAVRLLAAMMPAIKAAGPHR